MSFMETALLLGMGIPLVLLTGAFLVLVTWLQVCEDTAGSKA